MPENQKSPSPYKKNSARPAPRGHVSVSREELERGWKEEEDWTEEEGRGIAGKILAVVGILLAVSLAVAAVFFFRSRQKPSGTDRVAKTEAEAAADPGTGTDASMEASSSGTGSTGENDASAQEESAGLFGLFEKEEEGELIEMVENQPCA